MALEFRAYAITPAEHLVQSGRAHRIPAAAAAPAPDPAPPFGEMRGPAPGGLTEALAVRRYVFHGARVHGPEGAITVGRHAVQESLVHIWPPRAGAWQDGNRWLTLREYPGDRLEAAEHLLCGNAGNYYHWLLDGLVRHLVLAPGAAPLLLPGAAAPFHAEAAGLFPALAGRARFVAPEAVIDVDSLGWSTSLTAMGGAFHPLVGGLRAPAPPAPGAPAHLYVSRRDAAHRPLRNEAVVERLCRDRGFTPITLAGLPVGDQAALFAGARRIVAPHGAGLANLVFCRPGAAILELLMDEYANMCFRRLAACARLRWGCVVGRADPGGDPGWVHATAWTLDLDRLAAALDDTAFTPEAPAEETT